MRIGFDAIRALRNATGLGNYARGVLRALHRAAPGHQLHLYSSRPLIPEFRGLPDELGAALHLPLGARTSLARATWRTFRLGRAAARDGVEVFHGLTHEIPRDLARTGVRSVVTVHDLIFEKFPGDFPLVDRLSYRWRYRWSARHAEAIVAVSAPTRDDLIERWGIDAARVVVIPPVRDATFGVPVAPEARAAALARHGLPSEFLLSVGTLESRKNQGVLLEALAALPTHDQLPLVLVGRDGGTRQELESLRERLRLGERVLIRTEVATADLPALMQSAALFLYPSRAEGFGMPIVEALSAGIPVIAAGGGCLVDAGGPASRYEAADDPAAWAAAITELTGDSAVRARMRDAGIGHARRFDGDRVAARLLRVYDAVMAERSLA